MNMLLTYREKCEAIRNQSMLDAAKNGLTTDEFHELECDELAAKGRDLKRNEQVYLGHDAYVESVQGGGAITMALRAIHERVAMRLLMSFVGRAKVQVVDGQRKLMVDGMTIDERKLLTVIISDVQRLLQQDDINGMFEADDGWEYEQLCVCGEREPDS